MQSGQIWEVVGGAEKKGILVRRQLPLESPHLMQRLATGALVEGLELVGDRLHYKLLEGSGPEAGWVTIALGARPLLVPRDAAPLREKKAAPEIVARPQAGGANRAPQAPTKAAVLQVPSPAKSAEVAVRVYSIAGDEVALVRVAASSRIMDVKERLAKLCDVHVLKQRLLFGDKVLDDNRTVQASFGCTSGSVDVQLVRLTEHCGGVRVDVRGMWSLSGMHCRLTLDLRATLEETKELIQNATGRRPDLIQNGIEIEVGIQGGEIPWRKMKQTLQDVLQRTPEPEESVKVFIFACAPPEREELKKKLKNGQITLAEAVALDPDAFMPAC